MAATRRILMLWIAVTTLATLCITIAIIAIGGRPDPRPLRTASTLLEGPWRFRTGDDPRWAASKFDDSDWDTLDLRAAPGSHDGDVGWPDYVSGWMAHGYAGYQGHAWYRRTIDVPAGAKAWVILGPTQVDDGYALYWDGRKLGGLGRLDAPTRVVGSRPMLFTLPVDAAGSRSVLAIRAYMQPGNGFAEESGGLHNAPILAPLEVGRELHRAQWWRSIAGYIVEVTEPLAMLALAGLALALRRRSSHRDFLVWASVALALSAAKRASNAISSWTDLESVATYLWLVNIIWIPLGLAAWTLAWNRWSGRAYRIIDICAAVIAVACATGGGWAVSWLTSGSWFGSMVLFALIAIRIARSGTMRTMALTTMALLMLVLFSDELGSIGVPGIWFPFGIGVTRTQYVFAFAIPLLAVLIVRTVREPIGDEAWSLAPKDSAVSGAAGTRG